MPCKWHPTDPARGRGAFSLLELLIAVTLLVAILTVTASIVDGSSRVWRQANSKLESFQAARAAFDILTTRLSAATLNTYWDYFDSGGMPFRLAANPDAFTPARYGRYSDLHFVCGDASALLPSPPASITALASKAVFFTAPTGLSANSTFNGLPGLLGACGYFVAFGDDNAAKPPFLTTPARHRWRLMEVSTPVEDLQIFTSPSGSAWYTAPVSAGRVRAVADNIIALVLWPRRPPQDDSEGDDLAPGYDYDSRTAASWTGSPPSQPIQAHQLPPVLQVTMVAIDENTAARLQNGAAPPPAIRSALDGLFANDVTRHDQDVATLQRRLTDARIDHRVFSTSVALRESRWSR